jgi:hypothetical protein
LGDGVSNELIYDSDSSPICKAIDVNVGIVHKSRSQKQTANCRHPIFGFAPKTAICDRAPSVIAPPYFAGTSPPTPKAYRDATQRASGRRRPAVNSPHCNCLDAAGPRVEEPTPGLSVQGRHSGGGMHYALGYVCPAAGRFFARLRQTAPAPCSTFHLLHALWDTP